MRQSTEIPGVREVLKDCQQKLEAIIGEKLTVFFRIRINQISVDDLARIVCSVCDVSWKDILEGDRRAQYVIARHLFCYFSVERLRRPCTKVAALIGRDHSSVLSARDKIRDMIDTRDEVYHPLIEEIEEEIGKRFTEICSSK
jgi:chromosomal replication initiation ATPase DnaA